MTQHEELVLVPNLAEMKLHPDHFDLIIKCQKKLIQVHRDVVCRESKGLKAILNPNSSESKAGILQLPEEDYDAIEKLVTFLYEKDYDDADFPIEDEDPADKHVVTIRNLLASVTKKEIRVELPPLPSDEVESIKIHTTPYPVRAEVVTKSKKAADEIVKKLHCSFIPSGCSVLSVKSAPVIMLRTSPESLELNTKVYILADKYITPALKALAVSKNKKHIMAHWDSEQFLYALEFLWKHTTQGDRAMKDLFVQAARAHHIQLLKNSAFTSILDDYPDMNSEIFPMDEDDGRYHIDGNSITLECSRQWCHHRVVQCPKCNKCCEFYHIDTVEDDVQMDFLCGSVLCHAALPKAELVACRRCRALGRGPLWEEYD